MKRAKVVCFVNHTAKTGGAEFALNRLIDSMDRENWHPVVVFGEDGPAVELLRDRSIEAYVLPLDPEIGLARRESLGARGWLKARAALSSSVYVARLRSFFRCRAVDLVHTNSMKAHVLGGIAGRLARLPVVWHLRDSLHPAHLPAMALGVMRRLARTVPTRVISVSDSIAVDAFGARPGGFSKTIYDGLDSRCFEDPAPPPVRERSCWTVGIAGRLCPWKGQHVFLEAAAKLVEQGHKVRFEILGGPLFGEEEYERRLKAFVRVAALESHVVFGGFVSDVSRRIRHWDLLVHASTAPDPCPNVVLEAMAAGVPVVGANGGGVPELLDHGKCGGLFKMDDPSALTQCIEETLRHPERRMEWAASARQRALTLFRSERVAREVEAVWKSTVDPHSYQRRKWPWIEDGIQSSRAAKKRAPYRGDRATAGAPIAGDQGAPCLK